MSAAAVPQVLRKLIRASGETVTFDRPKSISAINQLLGATVCDTVALKHLGHPLHVMLVDDAGIEKDLPVNPEATKLYLANCRPGVQATIHGDVYVCPDDDFA